MENKENSKKTGDRTLGASPSTLQLKKSLLSCPGDTIQEHIDAIGMTQAELAERLGRSVPKVNELIKGKAPISEETATKLEYVLGIPAGFWLNLERQFRDELLEIEQMEHLEQYREWVSGFPLTTMRKLGIIPQTRSKTEMARSLLKFFRVASPEQWRDIYVGSSLAFKIELRHTAEPQAISVWLRLGELQAEKIRVSDFDKKKLTDSIPIIKDIAFNHSENWMDELQAVCASFGVALVYSPCISKAPIYGASRWIKNKTIPLIQLTDRRKDYNAFWFTFFHELAHIRYHNKREVFINGLNEISPDMDKEEEADAFASRMLLSDKERSEIIRHRAYDPALIAQLSQRMKKHPGIIVAQLQREGLLGYDNAKMNKLKPKVYFKAPVLG